MAEVLDLDQRRRTILPELESLRAAKNAASEEIAEAKRAGADAGEAIEAMRALGQQEKQLAADLAQTDSSLQEALSRLPNLPSEDAPQSDTVLKTVGEPRTAGSFLDHLELAGPLIDMEAGARLSGARFAYLRGELVMLELALVRWVLERLLAKGFEPVIPPVLVREQALYGTGFLPDTEPVSYTHLDVYKRQSRGSRAALRAPAGQRWARPAGSPVRGSTRCPAHCLVWPRRALLRSAPARPGQAPALPAGASMTSSVPTAP